MIGFLRDMHVRLLTGSCLEICAWGQLRHGKTILLLVGRCNPNINGCTMLGTMTKMPREGSCEIHHRKNPCLSCRAKKAGSVSSPKKSAANRAKAKFAARVRWMGRKKAKQMELSGGSHPRIL